VITQLLDINTTPIEIHMSTTPAKLVYDNTLQPQSSAHTEPAALQMKSHSVQLQIDTYEARKSLGMENSHDFAVDMGQRGLKALSKFIDTTVQEGDQMADTENGVTIADIIKQKMLEQPELVTVFLPQGGANISFQPGSLDVSYRPGSYECDWGKMGCEQTYTPGSFDVEVVQRPVVEINYIGGPAYVPPSANPNYQEPQE
jgi:hypothetical protein